jgi:molybdopterin converting factor small subunit
MENNDFEMDFTEDEAVVEQPIKSKTPATSKTPASGSGKTKNVYFRSTIGADKSEKLAVGENTPISEIKETVGNVFGLSPNDFHLSHAGRTLDENSTPKDYSVDNGDEVLLIPMSTAGASDEFDDFDDFEDLDSEPAAKPAMKSKTPAQVTSNVSGKTPVSGAGQKKNIFFRSTVGPERSEKLAVGENAPVSDIKETLGNLFGLDPEDFHLSHAGRTMNENSTPKDYGIDNGDEILLIPHSTAGMV